MIPMIDLLMVTISFLLITAVWTHMSRLDANARAPGAQAEPAPPTEVEKKLHVEMRSPDKFVLAWKQGTVTVDSIDVPRHEVVEQDGPIEVVRFPDLAARIASEWKAKGQHSNPTDPGLDQAVLHTDDRTPFMYLVGVMDAIYGAQRDVVLAGKRERVPAFKVTFAVN
jgi:biopolymer transport protein ExbD